MSRLSKLIQVLVLCSLVIDVDIYSKNYQNYYKFYNKHVIGAQQLSGFFSIFFQAINHLAWVEKNQKIPVIYWGSDCLYYQPEGYRNSFNAWEYYFFPVSNLKYELSDPINKYYCCPDGTGIEFVGNFGLNAFNYIKFANNIINKYVKIRPEILAKYRDFYDKHISGKPTIAIHIRGTDKNAEAGQINPNIIINEANKYKGYQYFVASDEQSLLNFAKNKLNGKVIAYDAIRSIDGKPIHLKKTSQNKALMGEEVLIEVLLLASCQMFIHTLSNVSTAAYFFNPNMNGILFNPWGQKYMIKNMKVIKN